MARTKMGKQIHQIHIQREENRVEHACVGFHAFFGWCGSLSDGPQHTIVTAASKTKHQVHVTEMRTSLSRLLVDWFA